MAQSDNFFNNFSGSCFDVARFALALTTQWVGWHKDTGNCVQIGSCGWFGNLPEQSPPRNCQEGGRGGRWKRLSPLPETRCGAEEVERADNSRGELFTPTEDDRVGRLFGLTGVGTESKSWSAAHKPPTAAVQTNTAGVSGGCRMRKAFITTPTPTKVGANVYWDQVGQGVSNL